MLALRGQQNSTVCMPAIVNPEAMDTPPLLALIWNAYPGVECVIVNAKKYSCVGPKQLPLPWAQSTNDELELPSPFCALICAR